MNKKDTIKSEKSKKTWKTPQVEKIDVAKNTLGKIRVFTTEIGNYAPS